MADENIKEIYKTTESVLDEALKKTHSIQLSGKEENSELESIITVLEEISTEFKQEIEKLESSSEWEKYCIAFFGETNAGKSTIIESLRIMYDEEKRRIEQLKQGKEYIGELTNHCDAYQGLLEKLKEINCTLKPEKKQSHIWKVVSGLGFVSVGIVIGYLVSHFGII